MKTIKIIDLLNKIANGEEKPKRIKWGEHYFEWFVYEYKAIKELGEPLFSQLGGFGKHFLNDEVEILDEEDEFEDIEHYDMFDYFSGYNYGGTNKELLSELQTNFEHINGELHFLIKNQKKIIEVLREKGDTR